MQNNIRIIPQSYDESRSAMDAVNVGGWVLLAAGVVLFAAPLVLNILIALFMIAVGGTLMVRRNPGDQGALWSGGFIVLFGVVALIWPTLFNYVIIALLLLFHALVTIWMFHWKFRGWAWIYLGVAILAGGLLLLFPTILNYLLASYLVMAGLYLLAWRWQLRSFMS